MSKSTPPMAMRLSLSLYFILRQLLLQYDFPALLHPDPSLSPPPETLNRHRCSIHCICRQSPIVHLSKQRPFRGPKGKVPVNGGELGQGDLQQTVQVRQYIQLLTKANKIDELVFFYPSLPISAL